MGAEIKRGNQIALLQTSGNSPAGQATHQGCTVHGSTMPSAAFQLPLSSSLLQDFQGRDTLSLRWEGGSSFQSPSWVPVARRAVAPGQRYSKRGLFWRNRAPLHGQGRGRWRPTPTQDAALPWQPLHGGRGLERGGGGC